MLRLLREQKEISVVMDQVGSPTWAGSVAGALWAAVRRPDLSGCHHWADAGVASWYDVAIAIQEESVALGLLSHCAAVHPVRSQEVPRPARRPSFSVLDTTLTQQLLGMEPAHWRTNLRTMLKEVHAA